MNNSITHILCLKQGSKANPEIATNQRELSKPKHTEESDSDQNVLLKIFLSHDTVGHQKMMAIATNI